MKTYLLHECAMGYLLLERKDAEEISAQDVEIQLAAQDWGRFEKMIKVVATAFYTNPTHAVENANLLSEGAMSDFLQEFLKKTVVAKAAKGDLQLGVADKALGSAIHEALNITCVFNEGITEFLRICRFHTRKLCGLEKLQLIKAQVGLAHAYSRNAIKFNIHRSDNMIIQAISLLDHMDKALNQLGMRVKEWYGWHFPELAKEVPEPLLYCKVALVIGKRDSITDENQDELLGKLTDIVNDELKAQAIVDKASNSMGGDIADIDFVNVEAFSLKVKGLADYRERLQSYLHHKIQVIAPNLSALMGDQITARLISHAGSLTNLAKAAASTIQILGAEKALFRALRAKKAKTPKYGLIFPSTFIGRAQKENKGKISRYLANKAALACRIDAFGDTPTSVFGEALREQMEQRLKFLETGAKPSTNAEVMSNAIQAFISVSKPRKSKKADAEAEEPPKEKKEKKKKRQMEEDE